MHDPEAHARALARLYDLDLLDDPGDLDLYLALAARVGGPILELASGSGRLAVPLAEAGYDVTGVDLDPAMLDRARAAADERGPQVARRLRWVEADLRDLTLLDAGSYRLAFIGLNSLFLLRDRTEQAAAIATLARHLTSGGLVVVDAWIPDGDDLARFDGRLMLEWVRVDPDTGRHVTKTGAALHDHATGVVRLTTLFDEGAPGAPPVRWIREDRLRLVGTDELRAMATEAGLEVETLAGGYDLERLTPLSDRAVLVARKP
jgi:SAM-dependent methyltransferase